VARGSDRKEFAVCLPLSGADWSIREDSSEVGRGNPTGTYLNKNVWIPAWVPGNIQADLEAVHVLSPLWYGLGDPHLAEVAKKDWWYRKDFNVPRVSGLWRSSQRPSRGGRVYRRVFRYLPTSISVSSEGDREIQLHGGPQPCDGCRKTQDPHCRPIKGRQTRPESGQPRVDCATSAAIRAWRPEYRPCPVGLSCHRADRHSGGGAQTGRE